VLLGRGLAWLALVVGLLGVAICLAGGYVVWVVSARLEQVNERVFRAVDRSLEFARDRVLALEARARELRITGNEIEKSLKEWTARKAGEELAARLELERRTEKLAQKLQQADAWLESATESVNGARRIVELAGDAGAQVQPDLLDEVLGHIGELRGAAQQASETVEDVRQFATGEGGESRLARALHAAGRILVTITELDTRLGKVALRLSDLRTRADELKAKTHRRIVVTRIVSLVLVAWMAAGQVGLCLYGWKRCRGSRAPA
jgi:hypothetical protein